MIWGADDGPVDVDVLDEKSEADGASRWGASATVLLMDRFH